MSENPHQPSTGAWHLHEATDWVVIAEQAYFDAADRDSVEQVQQAHAAATIAQAHATIGAALDRRPATAPLP